MSKFKVGDRVRLKDSHPHRGYDFQGTVGEVKKGDVVTISHVGSGDNPNYNVHGSYVNEPNWNNMERYFELVKKGKQPKVTHLIVYDLTDKDLIVYDLTDKNRIIYCFSPKELRTELSKLYDNSDVIQSSIKVYEVSKVFETKNNVSLREIK